jgi:enoyl-CoA hydratase/carnithine racemase
MTATEEEVFRYLPEDDGKVVRLMLNRPGKRNAIDDELGRALTDGVYRLSDDDNARVGVLCGAGSSFCSGVDVKTRQLRPREELERYGGPQGRGSEIGRLGLRLGRYKPIIAAVQGYAIGAGLRLMLRAEMAIVDRDAKFQVTHIDRGLSGFGLWLQIRDRSGEAFANDVALTGRVFGAEEALRRGIVTEVVEPGQSLERALEIARIIAAKPAAGPRALVRGRRRMVERLEYDEVALAEADQLYLTSDFADSARGFLGDGKR